ncbi:type II toxin-antitoxin system RelE/ParE family toxin [Streptomyces virginiae]|uniref:type II toxin-antitoxin system RelE/ParE family toxin n=1 Tax=Streptomyces virginiae TaxID=1961 RepID=UPI0022533A9B|nr:type II toxin-antitoxin system RelE/ParE family toxin [Streptomyces virginiae]MCX5178593.1 type II toxin-antitoxin system RelE/ParE family toxin [Streptomyces virginiae]
MDDLYTIEVEPEVRTWLEGLTDKQHHKVEEYAELLATSGTRTPMPFARPLSDGVYELRPTLDGVATRITYWFAPGRRIVLLTVFRKTRPHEQGQVRRAVSALIVCRTEHGPAHTTYSRGNEGNAS